VARRPDQRLTGIVDLPPRQGESQLDWGDAPICRGPVQGDRLGCQLDAVEALPRPVWAGPDS
jgi:hypothetical protein